MMGRRKSDQGQLFYAFDLDAVVPDDHQVRRIAAVLDLSWVCRELAPHYSHTGRPSTDPELMIRMLILGYVLAKTLVAGACESRVIGDTVLDAKTAEPAVGEVQLHFPAKRALRADREHDIFRSVFERIVTACIKAGLVGGTGFAVDASLIAADANKCRSTPGDEWSSDIDPEMAQRAVRDYLATLDDPAWGAASDVVPKFVAPADPAAQWTGALRNAAFFAYADNYLIDVKFGIIMDVEASRAIRQAEVGASQAMIDRTEATFGIKPDWLVADTAYGSAPNLHFLVDQKGIEPHVPVVDKSKREDGTFSREDFIYYDERDFYVCPNGKALPRSNRKRRPRGDDMISYFSRVADCRDCPLKPRCCPKSPSRRITRHIHEAARDVARAVAKTTAYEETRRDRKKVEMLFAHLKRILRMNRLRLRGPAGAQFEFTLAAIAQNLRRLAKLTFHPPDAAVPSVA